MRITIISDKSLFNELNNALGECTELSFYDSTVFGSQCDQLIELLTFSDVADVVILSIQHLSSNTIGMIAKALYFMGIIVVVDTDQIDSKTEIQNAMARFDVIPVKFSEQNLIQLLNSLKSRLGDLDTVFFSENLCQDNHYSEDYDNCEHANLGTLFEQKFEDELVSEIVKDVIFENSNTPLNPIRILDVGAGTARFEDLILGKHFAECVHLTAVDYSPGMLAKAKIRLSDYLKVKPNRVALVRGLCERIRCVSDKTFDVIIMGFGVPSFVKDIGKTLCQLRELLSENGRVLFTFYNRPIIDRICFGKQNTEYNMTATVEYINGSYRMGPDENIIDFTPYSVDEFVQLMKVAGFQDTGENYSASTFPSLVLQGMLTPIPASLAAYNGGSSYHKDDPLKIGFDYLLYEADCDYCQRHQGNGYYANIVWKNG